MTKRQFIGEKSIHEYFIVLIYNVDFLTNQTNKVETAKVDFI